MPGIRRHYIRVNPASSVDCADEDPNCGTLVLANQPPGARNEFPAKERATTGPAVALPCLARQKESLYKDTSSDLVFARTSAI